MDQLQLEIMEIFSETADTKTFVFKTTQPFTYKAGQFLTFLFERNGRELRRSYSLSSSPYTDTSPSITLKKVVNGENSGWWIEQAKIGDMLLALPPAGVFTIEWQTRPRDIFLIAAGTGITPIYSLIKSALWCEPQSRIHLIYSNSQQETTIFYMQLLTLQQLYPAQLFIEWRFSNHKNLLKARLSTYNLQTALANSLTYSMQDALVYTCGPYNFMLMVQITCLTMGFAKQNVRKEIFDIAPPATSIKRYFDTNDRIINVLFNQIHYVVHVPYQLSILDAALQQGIPLPYSCKAGRCSACRCKVLAGSVWMHYNEVLTEADEKNGSALTCTGHPASEHLTIEI